MKPGVVRSRLDFPLEHNTCGIVVRAHRVRLPKQTVNLRGGSMKEGCVDLQTPQSFHELLRRPLERT